MKSVLKILAAACLMTLAATAARAQAYIGGSLGLSAMEPTVAEDTVNQWNAIVWGPGNDCDSLGCSSQEESSGGLKFFGGYRVNPYFAVEGFIAHLGTFDSYANDGLGVESYATADVRTLGIAAVGMIPVSQRVDLLGKIGVHGWSADGDVILWDDVFDGGLVGSYDASGTDLMGGLGVDIGFGEHLAMRVEFEYFAATTTYTDFGVGFLSVGMMYRF